MRVAVLKGGRSFEREVSLRSGVNVEAALTRLGHEVLPVDVDGRLVRTLRAERPDAAFVALHGLGGEDGTVQELLEILEIPYTGSGVLACERSMDKVVAKAHFGGADIPTPPAFAFSQGAFRELGAADALPDIEARLGLPLVVKPAKAGLRARHHRRPHRGRDPRRDHGGARLRRSCADRALRPRTRARDLGDRKRRAGCACPSSSRSRSAATSTTSRPATRRG